jgi:hypothetical protein
MGKIFLLPSPNKLKTGQQDIKTSNDLNFLDGELCGII